MRVTRDNFCKAIETVNDAMDGVEAVDALRGIIVYVMTLETALDRADNDRRAVSDDALRALGVKLPNPWQHVTDGDDAGTCPLDDASGTCPCDRGDFAHGCEEARLSHD